MRQCSIQLCKIVDGSEFGGALHGLHLVISFEIEDQDIGGVCYRDHCIRDGVRS